MIEKEDNAKEKVLEMNIDELELSVRSYNCLKRAGRFAAAFVSGLINVAVAVYFQFFSSIHFDSAKELVTFLEGRTNLTISEYALDIEYFLKMDYQ